MKFNNIQLANVASNSQKPYNVWQQKSSIQITKDHGKEWNSNKMAYKSTRVGSRVLKRRTIDVHFFEINARQP